VRTILASMGDTISSSDLDESKVRLRIKVLSEVRTPSSCFWGWVLRIDTLGKRYAVKRRVANQVIGRVSTLLQSRNLVRQIVARTPTKDSLTIPVFGSIGRI